MESVSTEVKQYIFKLKSQHDIGDHGFLTELVIHLSAKKIKMNHNKAASKVTSFEDFMNLSMNMFNNNFQNEYIHAVDEVSPGFALYCDNIYIHNKIVDIATADKGLEICYAFLADNASRKSAFPDFSSKSQITYQYKNGSFLKKDIASISQIIRLINENEQFEFQLIDFETKAPKSMYDFKLLSVENNIHKFTTETLKLLVYLNPNRTVRNYRLEDANGQWAIDMV